MYPVKSYKPFDLFYFCVIASVAIPKHEIEYKIMPMLFVDFFLPYDYVFMGTNSTMETRRLHSDSLISVSGTHILQHCLVRPITGQTVLAAQHSSIIINEFCIESLFNTT